MSLCGIKAGAFSVRRTYLCTVIADIWLHIECLMGFFICNNNFVVKDGIEIDEGYRET